MILAKGHAAVKLSKVKGHPTQQMVGEGSVKRDDWVGNQYADEAADEGARDVDETLSGLASLYNRKNQHYKKIWNACTVSSPR